MGLFKLYSKGCDTLNTVLVILKRMTSLRTSNGVVYKHLEYERDAAQHNVNVVFDQLCQYDPDDVHTVEHG